MVLIRVFIISLVLVACSRTVPPDGRPAPVDRVAAECRMLERAVAEAGQRGLGAPPDILLGCPGHEGLRGTMSMAQMSAATRAANAAEVPPSARAMGARADMVYRRMITRGVPEVVARDMAETPEFAAALR